LTVKRLGVWHDDVLVAELDAKRPWDLRCRYSAAAIEAGDANRPLLSCSLPVTRQKVPATPWVRGLLPEGEHLLAVATTAGVPTNYYADLLARYGRDVAGAFTISVDEPDERRWAVEPYDDNQLAAELRSVVDAPGFAIRDDSELSIAGLQNKLLVCALDDGQWGRPVHGRPSSHIMKLDGGRYDDLLAAEHACLRLASDAGLRAAHSNLINVDGLDVLVVERYDRRRTDDGILGRIHQEDSCQALGVNIDDQHGRGKYERFGGPTFAQIAELCDRYGDPTTAFPDLLANAVFTWVIGNGDAHGKNVSLLIDIQTGHVDLAPLYDTVPTALWPTLRPTAAMSVNGKHEEVSRNDFVAEARRWGFAQAGAERVIDDLVVRLVAAAADCRDERVASLVVERLDILQH
jgi:serine/threonine-protein kinase HipA